MMFKPGDLVCRPAFKAGDDGWDFAPGAPTLGFVVHYNPVYDNLFANRQSNCQYRQEVCNGMDDTQDDVVRLDYAAVRIVSSTHMGGICMGEKSNCSLGKQHH